MGLFGEKESKEEKQKKKEAEILDRYGLSNVDTRDIQSIKNIINDLSGNGLIKAGMA